VKSYVSGIKVTHCGIPIEDFHSVLK